MQKDLLMSVRYTFLWVQHVCFHHSEPWDTWVISSRPFLSDCKPSLEPWEGGYTTCTLDTHVHRQQKLSRGNPMAVTDGKATVRVTWNIPTFAACFWYDISDRDPWWYDIYWSEIEKNACFAKVWNPILLGLNTADDWVWIALMTYNSILGQFA